MSAAGAYQVGDGSARSRPTTNLLVAVLGYGLTFWAWTSVGPVGLSAGHRAGLGDGALIGLAALAVAVGALTRIPVGVFTDRYGARLLLPTVAMVTALPALALAVVDTGPALVVVAAGIGLAGGAFASGSALVVRAYPVGRRGVALSVFGAGAAIGPVAALSSAPYFAVDGRGDLLVLAVALVGYAALAVILIRDRPVRRVRRMPVWRLALRVLALPATRQLATWYALAFGAVVAIGLYLPAYLRQVYGTDRDQAAAYTVAIITVAALTRPAGGLLCRRGNPVRTLAGCLAAVAAFGLALALRPPLPAVAMLLLVLGACLGTAAGVVLALIGTTAPPERAGTIAGAVGAIGALAGLLPPLLLAAVYGVNGTYDIGLTLLAGAALAGAGYLCLRGRWLTAALAFPATTAPEHTATTLVTLPTSPDPAAAPQLTAALAALATRHELVIIAPTGSPGTTASDGYGLVAALRTQLPRHQLLAITVGAEPHPHETALITQLLNDGAVPVVLVIGNPEPAAVLLAAALHVDHVLRVSHHQIDGILLRPPWTIDNERRSTPSPEPATRRPSTAKARAPGQNGSARQTAP